MTHNQLNQMADTYADGIVYDAILPDGRAVYDQYSVKTAYARGVDDYLREVWHAAHDIPSTPEDILIKERDTVKYHIGYYADNGHYRIHGGCTLPPDNVQRWAYIHDLTRIV